MKLGELSDVHLEQYADVDMGLRLLKYLQPKEVLDILILAGDIFSLKGQAKYRYIDEFRKWAVEILFVPGNHCYYNTNPNVDGKAGLKSLASEGVRVLGPTFWESFTYQGQKFVGSTCWYPDNEIVRLRLMTWSDRAYIKGFMMWWQHQQLVERKMLWNNVDKDTVVVTHMLPTWSCVAQKFITDSHNCLFVSDVEDLIIDKKPKLWVCGHSHHNMDIMVDQTRVVSNAIGYFHEHLADLKVLEIDF